MARDNSGWVTFRRLLEPVSDRREADPWRGHLFGGRRRLFIDRAALRSHLPELIGSKGPRVLVTDGPRFSGRSYTWHLIAHVSQALGGYRAYSVDLREWVGTQIAPPELMVEIATALGWPRPDFDVSAQEDAQEPVAGSRRGTFRRQRRTPATGPTTWKSCRRRCAVT